MEQITVRVPATTANLGPGFDSVGCAFALYNTITFAKSNKLEFEGCDKKYANENNLAVVAFRKALAKKGLTANGIKVIFNSIDVPVSRGLGSSAALIVAGAFAANELYNLNLTKHDILCVCNEIEGHPDNLSPAIYGGLTASLTKDGIPYSVHYDIHRRISFVALIPDFELETNLARSVLPKQVAHSDAVFNESHLAVLLKALENGDKQLISLALDDKLHQPYRYSLINGYETAKQCAVNNGCISFCISGAGPTCLCLTDKADFAENLKADLTENGLGSWKVIDLAVDYEGTKAI